jgi:hypothetical protein
MTIAEELEEDPISVFLYALKAPETRRHYSRRLKVFPDYLKLEGTSHIMRQLKNSWVH